MGFFKSLTLSLLSFLLFLSLSAFGLAFMVQRTVLNPDFVIAELTEVNRIILADLTEELIEDQAETGESVSDVNINYAEAISDLEPLVNEQLSVAIYSTLDYLLGRKPDPELKLMLRETFLSDDFLVAVIDKLNISSLLKTNLKELLLDDLPPEFKFIEGELDGFIDETFTELKPWLEEEARSAATPLVDYLLGDSPHLKAVISLEQIKKIFREKMLAAFLESPPPELSQLPPATQELAFDKT